jgi:tRNA dimethylallyltransferase
LSFRALLIAGPTASGKSAVALGLATRLGATIVNADSMQVYRDLSVITARPEELETRMAPHRLFGEIDGAVNYSVGRWLDAASVLLGEVKGPLIFVGGTGLYFRALTEGLSDIPRVPEDVREEIRARAGDKATPTLHAWLADADPDAAARLRPSDRQRVLRALEVVAATGKSLLQFHGARQAALLRRDEWRGIFLAPERPALNARIAARFSKMLERGAIDEVAALASRELDPALPVMRAHGVPHLIGYLEGRLTLDEATELAVRDTRRYAKRQFTWARHQMPDFPWTAPEEAEALGAAAFEEADRRGGP